MATELYALLNSILESVESRIVQGTALAKDIQIKPNRSSVPQYWCSVHDHDHTAFAAITTYFPPEFDLNLPA